MASGSKVILKRIVSGGQTGVDRAALDAAISVGLEHGGWCPRGRLAEDGIIPPEYQLRETWSADYPARTEQNVRDSDGTLILCHGPLQGGTDLTWRMTQRHAKPCFVVDLSQPPEQAAARQWLNEQQIETLNIAGPRESTQTGIQRAAYDWLLQLLTARG
jgi:predicted Rossmann-fold nucleotide-binding protein